MTRIVIASSQVVSSLGTLDAIRYDVKFGVVSQRKNYANYVINVLNKDNETSILSRKVTLHSAVRYGTRANIHCL